MAQELNFYVNNQLVPPPDNYRSLQIELSFENNSPEAVLNSTKLIWKGSDAALMTQWAQSGLNGGVGIFEGVPLEIQACGTSITIFNGIIDLTDSETTFACDIVTCKIRDKRMDMVSQLLDTISFAFLATPVADGGAGLINPSPQDQGGDYVVIPYQLNNIPDYVQVMMMGLSLWTIIDKLENIKLSQIVADVQNIVADSSDLVAAIAALDAGGAAMAGIDLAKDILILLAYLAYIVFLILCIIDLLKSMFNYLISPVFTKFGMYALTLIEKMCDYFDIGFSSTILQNAPYNNLILMPRKYAWSNNNTVAEQMILNFIGLSSNTSMSYDDYLNWQSGGPAYGYYDGTCGDLIRDLEAMFNAKAKIIFDVNGNPVLHLERWDYIYNIANYTLPNISDQTPFNTNGLFNTSGQSRSAFATNASEVPANYYVKWAVDSEDLNTFNDYSGNLINATTTPIKTNNIQFVTLQGLVGKDLHFSHATRKDSASFLENLLGYVWSFAAGITNIVTSEISAVAKLFNSPSIPSLSTTPNFTETGHMYLYNHFTSTPKAFIGGDSQLYSWLPFCGFGLAGRTLGGITIDPNNKSYIGASTLMKNFHFSNLGQSVYPGPPYSIQAAGTPYYNQYLLYKSQNVPLCCDDYLKLQNYNIFYTYDGQQARIDSIKWDVHKGLAMIDYRVNQQYTTNLQVSYIIDGWKTTTAL